MTIRSTMMLAGSVFVLAISANAMAQTATEVPGHPRVNEVDQRLQNQQNREANGGLNARQEARDSARDAKVAEQLSADQAKHNGHITKAEKRHLNKELNRNSRAIKRQEHRNAEHAAAPATPATPATPAAQ